PLGFRSVFSKAFEVDESKFTQYDWISDTGRMVEDIKVSYPDMFFRHNGQHAGYGDALERARKEFPTLPYVYTELGWFPQKDHIYLDRWGVNGNSSLAAMRLREASEDNLNKEVLVKRDIFIPAQLDADTNLKVFSPRFRTIDSFIE